MGSVSLGIPDEYIMDFSDKSFPNKGHLAYTYKGHLAYTYQCTAPSSGRGRRLVYSRGKVAQKRDE